MIAVAMAFAAAAAPGAQAQFTSSASHTTLSGAQATSFKFTAGAGIGSISCTTATLAGTMEGTSASTIALDPTYSNCKDSLGRTVHAYEACPYLLAIGALAGPGAVLVVGSACIGLVFYAAWVVTGSTNCTISLAMQTNNGVTINNLGGTNGIELVTNSNNVHSSISGGFFACGTSATTSSTGTYTGTFVIKGNGGAASISRD